MSAMNTDARRKAHNTYRQKLVAQGVKLVSLRLPADLRERVESHAKANDLSVNAAYEALVRRGLAGGAVSAPRPRKPASGSIKHLDGNPLNNSVENLEIVPAKAAASPLDTVPYGRPETKASFFKPQKRGGK